MLFHTSIKHLFRRAGQSRLFSRRPQRSSSALWSSEVRKASGRSDVIEMEVESAEE